MRPSLRGKKSLLSMRPGLRGAACLSLGLSVRQQHPQGTKRGRITAHEHMFIHTALVRAHTHRALSLLPIVHIGDAAASQGYRCCEGEVRPLHPNLRVAAPMRQSRSAEAKRVGALSSLSTTSVSEGRLRFSRVRSDRQNTELILWLCVFFFVPGCCTRPRCTRPASRPHAASTRTPHTHTTQKQCTKSSLLDVAVCANMSRRHLCVVGGALLHAASVLSAPSPPPVTLAWPLHGSEGAGGVGGWSSSEVPVGAQWPFGNMRLGPDSTVGWEGGDFWFPFNHYGGE